VLFAASGWAFWDKPEWGAAEAWSVATLLLPSAIAWILVSAGKQAHLFKRFITGKDGAWSTSKAGYLFWTYVILFAGVAMLLHLHDLGDIDDKFKGEYLLVLGFPAFAAAAAKGLRSTDDETTESTATQPTQTSVTTGVAQLVTDDSGDTALHKFQYLVFNLLLIGVFLASFLSDEDKGWPNLPHTLLGLTGVAAATYVAGRGLDKSVTGPVVRDVVPRKAKAKSGATVRIYAVNVAREGATDVRVTFEGIEARATTTLGDGVASIDAILPDEVTAGAARIHVTGVDGNGADWTDFAVEP
jgi:hypothetical protein